MTEETTVEQKPPEAPTLESLYQEYNVQPTGEQPPPQQTSSEQTPPEKEDAAAIQQEIARFRQELAAERQTKAAVAEQEDFQHAIAAVSQEAELEGKDTVIRGYLIAKAHEDERLRALWDKRKENPQAWSKALKILAGEVKKEFAVPNPQLEENQRAMEESQRTQSTTAPPPKSKEEDVLRMSQAEFSQFWGRLAGRG